MDNTKNYLQVLSESLDKKILIIDELSKLTEIQKDIVSADSFDDEAFDNNVEQKAGLINELIKLDNGFQILYDNVKKLIEGNKDMYKEEILLMQDKIRSISDKNASLQVAEARNKELISKRFAVLKREARQMKKNRSAAANYYKSMNNISNEPIFMDKKK